MNPLDQLEPLIAPQAVSWWPPAPGWWLLLLLALAALTWAIRAYRRRTPRLKKKRTDSSLDPVRLAALTELNQLQKPYYGVAAGPWLQQLNGVLKRLCRHRYPDSNSHVLSGREWLAFLDNRCPAAGLTRWMVLVEGNYKPNCILDDKAIEGLNSAVDIWIRKHV
ncbi:DUF4381 domain-containing protein [Pseudomonas sp. RL_15y_Pfl2_60]|uniref:DUF4381 domain-containing protein n=1 Tax=Pseudomonas sp. RL_15y_Pfl2_60 TaxID=3088709 RepID=UPI0030DBB5E7